MGQPIQQQLAMQVGGSNSQLQYVASDVEGECTLKEVQTIRLSTPKFIIFAFLTLLSAGIPLLLTHWYPTLKRLFYYDQASLEEATHVAVLNYDEYLTICPLQEQQICSDEQSQVSSLTFTNRYLKYSIDGNQQIKTILFDQRGRLKRIALRPKGLQGGEVGALRQCYGLGTMQIQRVKWYQLLIKELFRPLYLFLFFSTSLWIYQEYYVYTFIVLATCFVAIAITVYQLISLNQKIYTMAYSQIDMQTLRDGEVKRVSSVDLVPGDVVFIKDPIKLPFQGVIIEGSALINQCALTGESVPVVKKADSLQNYQKGDRPTDRTASAHEGTSIIQVNCQKRMVLFEQYRETFGIPVCVTRTNFVTLKGQLIRIILFPKEQENIFQKESGKFLFFLFSVSLITFLGMIPQLLKTDSASDVIVSFLDLVAITVPAALPVSMAFGVIYSVSKLKQKGIFCIKENKVIAGGDVSFCCFDKTGTLTEDFMDFEALIPSHRGEFEETIQNRAGSNFNVEQTMKIKPYLAEVFGNMAANHSIIKIQASGELVGDPMEIKLFEFGEFSISQSNQDPDNIFSYESKRSHKGQVLSRFQFDSDMQRMSVVCHVQTQSQSFYSVYAKGSPQVMVTIMHPPSVPNNYFQTLKQYTSNGFRVLAIASKRLKDSGYKDLTRQMTESDLVFTGFQIFQNKLKPQSKGVIKELRAAEIGVVMITGDNAITGSNIAYKCSIAHRSQGMIIVDYQFNGFTEEDFLYHEHDKENEQTSNPPPMPFHNSLKEQLLRRNTQKKPIEIQIVENYLQQQDSRRASRLSRIKEDKPQSSAKYIRQILKRARQNGCQLCLTGNAFNKLFEGKVEDIPDIKKELLEYTSVFARTKPNDKAKIVMVYQHTGRTVSMCGDGANDCGALKQADIGLSLSPAQASISAPFTSQVPNISAILQLIKECRAGLATNFSLFNIMAIYALTMYVATSIAEIFYAYPAQYQYMYWDLACNFLFIIFVGYTGTAEKLSVARPSNSLFCFSNLWQVMFAFILVVLGDIAMILSLSGIFSNTIDYPTTGGFEVNLAQLMQNGDRSSNTPQTSILFLFSNLMYIFTLVAFNLGQPWRKPIYTNRLFMGWLLVVLTYSLLIIMVPATRWNLFQIQYMNSTSLNGFVLGMGLLFGSLILGLQKLLWQPLFQWLKQKYPYKTWL